MTTRPTPAYAPGVHIRDMALGDCPAVADLRVRSWRTAYAGMIPQWYLDAMDIGRDTELRRAHLAADGGPVNLVAGTRSAGAPDTTPALDARGGFDEVAFRGGPKPPTSMTIRLKATWTTHASVNAPDEYDLTVRRRKLRSRNRGGLSAALSPQAAG